MGLMKFRLNNKEPNFNICRSTKKSCELRTVSIISYRIESIYEVPNKERVGVEALAAVIMYFESDDIEDYGSFMASFEQN